MPNEPTSRKHIELSSDDIHHPPDFLDDCQVNSHVQCLPEECEVKRLLSSISEGQIRVTIMSAKITLVLSCVMAFSAFLYHLWCHAHGMEFVLLWWEVTIIMMPFGGALILKIQEQIPFKVEPGSKNT